LNWSSGSDDAPAKHATSPVTYNGDSFGYLHAPEPATAETLGAWAAWLGRWLAMERRFDQLWEMALRDELTGAWNRRYFNRFLNTVLQRAANERFRVTLLVFDIDDFKRYNDEHGHDAGDEILVETVRLQVGRARALFRSADPLLARLRGAAVPLVAGYAAGGLATCDALERQGFDVLAHAVRPARRDVLRHATRLVGRTWLVGARRGRTGRDR